MVAAALGAAQGGVSAVVHEFQPVSTLTLHGNSSGRLSDATQLAIVAGLASALSLSPSQIELTLPLETRRHLLTPSEAKVVVTVLGLGANATAVRNIAGNLTSPVTLAGLVARLNDSAISGIDATPATFNAVLTLTVVLPPMMAPDALLASLNAALGTSLAAALSAAGFVVSATTGFVRSPPAPAPPALPVPPTAVVRESVAAKRRTAVLASTLTFAVLVIVLVAWTLSRRLAMRRDEREAQRRARAMLMLKTFDPEHGSSSGQKHKPSQVGLSALEIASGEASSVELLIGKLQGMRTLSSALHEAQPTTRLQNLLGTGDRLSRSPSPPALLPLHDSQVKSTTALPEQLPEIQPVPELGRGVLIAARSARHSCPDILDAHPLQSPRVSVPTRRSLNALEPLVWPPSPNSTSTLPRVSRALSSSQLDGATSEHLASLLAARTVPLHVWQAQQSREARALTFTLFAGSATGETTKRNSAQVVMHGKLGSGGYGAVFAASWKKRSQAVVIKSLVPDVHIVLEEAERAATLRHPHLLCAIGFLQLPDKSLLLMPRGEGGSLASLLNNATAAAQLGWPRRTALAAGVASGLAYLHAQTPPIPHRDVKPENILLEEDFSPLLSDAWILSCSPTGTTLYAPPEVVQRSAPPDNPLAADVYAFGSAVLHPLAHAGVIDAETFVTPLYRAVIASYGGPRPAKSGNVPAGWTSLQVHLARALASWSPEVAQGCPAAMAAAISSCCAESPAARPSAEAMRVETAAWTESADTW